MAKKLVICPACGSKDVTEFKKDGSDYLTLGTKFSFEEIYFKCNSCKEEGDFLAKTDKNYLIAQKEAQTKLVKQIIENLSKAGIAMAMIERVFELPARTLTRWKTGDFSSSALALLRITITYPWITEVAEHKFDSNFASHAVIKAAVREFEQETAKNITHLSYPLQSEGSSSAVAYHVTVSTQNTKSTFQKPLMVGG